MSNLLEIQVSLSNGKVYHFVQNDPTIVQKTLDHIQPNKLFSPANLSIGGDHSLSTVLSSAVVRIDLIGNNLPEWPFYHGTANIEQITPQQFQERYRPEDFTPARVETAQINQDLISVFGEIELLNGDHLLLQVHTHLQMRLPLEQGIFIQQLFTASGLHARRQDGGYIFLNPHNIACLTLHPGPPDIPPGAWVASRVIK
jgi:hypothetical protein